MYSIVETAKANKVNVLRYLEYLFEEKTLRPQNSEENFMENLMRDVMFQIPSDPGIKGVEITAACVRGEDKPKLIRAA